METIACLEVKKSILIYIVCVFLFVESFVPAWCFLVCRKSFWSMPFKNVAPVIYKKIENKILVKNI